MHPPFTADEFFDVFRQYNEAIWPAQILLISIGIVAAAAAYRANQRHSWRWAQLSILLLATLWLWTGIVYFKSFFATLTVSGQIFGSLFVAQGGLLLLALWQNGPVEPVSRAGAVVGTILLAYALVIYPAIGIALEHRFPAAPSFGTPCPTTIFTFGVFCLLATSIPRFALAIPVLWAVIGSYAGFAWGVREDIGLVTAAAAALFVIVRAAHKRPIALGRDQAHHVT